MKKLSKSNLTAAWQKIDESFQLFLPKNINGIVGFAGFQEEGTVDLEALKTAIPLKNFVFPQSETFLKFRTENKKIKFQVESAASDKYVIFGARPCDVKSLEILDNIFLREPVDTYYKAHRDNGIIISLACQKPETSCFCEAFQIDAAGVPASSDVSLVEAGDFYYWKVNSSKGEELTQLLGDLLEGAQDAAALENERNRIREQVKNLPLNGLNLEEMENDLHSVFDMEKVWKDLARRCLACGSCTYVCPTCHCYDVKDYAGNKGGERFRCWDSCMYSDFTLMAHGNPRTEQMQRVRQRFMHKLVYYPNNHEGTHACVGCGRCIEKCPVHIDIVKVIKKLVVNR